jgi:hypothetical protein
LGVRDTAFGTEERGVKGRDRRIKRTVSFIWMTGEKRKERSWRDVKLAWAYLFLSAHFSVETGRKVWNEKRGQPLFLFLNKSKMHIFFPISLLCKPNKGKKIISFNLSLFFFALANQTKLSIFPVFFFFFLSPFFFLFYSPLHSTKQNVNVAILIHNHAHNHLKSPF